MGNPEVTSSILVGGSFSFCFSLLPVFFLGGLMLLIDCKGFGGGFFPQMGWEGVGEEASDDDLFKGYGRSNEHLWEDAKAGGYGRTNK